MLGLYWNSFSWFNIEEHLRVSAQKFFFLLYPEVFLCIWGTFLLTDPVVLTFSADVFWQEGKASGAVYSGAEELTELLVKVNASTQGSVGGLCPSSYLSLSPYFCN